MKFGLILMFFQVSLISIASANAKYAFKYLKEPSDLTSDQVKKINQICLDFADALEKKNTDQIAKIVWTISQERLRLKDFAETQTGITVLQYLREYELEQKQREVTDSDQTPFGLFDHLNEDLYFRLFRYVPFTSLVQCRGVCRSWKSFLDDSKTKILHTHRALNASTIKLIYPWLFTTSNLSAPLLENLETGEKFNLPKDYGYHASAYPFLVIHDWGTQNNDPFTLLNLETKETMSLKTLTSEPITMVRLSPKADKISIYSERSNTSEVYTLPSFKHLTQLQGCGFLFSPSSELLVVGQYSRGQEPSKYTLFNTTTFKTVSSFATNTSTASNRIEFSQNETQLLIRLENSNQYIRVDLKIPFHKDVEIRTGSLREISPNGRWQAYIHKEESKVAFTRPYPSVRIIDSQTNTVVQEIPGVKFEFTPDSRFILVKHADLDQQGKIKSFTAAYIWKLPNEIERVPTHLETLKERTATKPL